jgi:hypothetical protein
MKHLSEAILPVFLILLCAIVLTISYAVFSQFGQSSLSDASQVDSTGTIITYGEPFPAPEYEIGGGIIALTVCLAAFVVYTKRRNNSAVEKQP